MNDNVKRISEVLEYLHSPIDKHFQQLEIKRLPEDVYQTFHLKVTCSNTDSVELVNTEF